MVNNCTVWLIHNRPHDNNCYDDFVGWCVSLGLDARMMHWRSWDPAFRRPGDRVLCAMQDPVGRVKARVLPDDALNHPRHSAIRDDVYPTWLENGIPCPGEVQDFDYDLAVEALATHGKILLKETSKQMGRAYFVDSVQRLDQVWLEAKRFKEEQFKIVPFIDTRYSDGRYRLHRYLVAGGKAVPLVVAASKGWNSKASHTRAKLMTPVERENFIDEFFRFWQSTPPANVIRAAELTGLDAVLVDTTITEDGSQQYFWEVNPYLNLRPAEAPGKRERWWPFVANWLFDCGLIMTSPSREDVLKTFTEFAGYKLHWTKANAPQPIDPEGGTDDHL